MEGKQYHIAALDSERAKELADHAAVLQDLRFCIAACDRAKAALQSETRDAILLRSLWTAALVAYARCFASGVRIGLSPAVFDHFEGEPRRVHDLYMELRNKHIAHSVSPFEQITVGALLSPADAAVRSVEGTVTLVGANLIGSFENIEQLRLLAATATKAVSLRGKQLDTEVLDEARAVPIDELYGRATPRIIVPPQEAAFDKRS